MYLDNSNIPPILVDIISDVVDSMRETNTIASSIEVESGMYELVSSNYLQAKEQIQIDNNKYKVLSSDSTKFTIQSDTGLDFSGLTWKASAPYYEHGHPLEITNTLTAKDKGKFSYTKYPLIALLQDFEESNDDSTDFYATTAPTIVIVNSTKKELNASERYDYNFRNVLYPLYSMLLTAIHKNGSFNIRSSKLISHTKIDSPYYGSNENEGNKMNDYLDAIVLNNVDLPMIYKPCNK